MRELSERQVTLVKEWTAGKVKPGAKAGAYQVTSEGTLIYRGHWEGKEVTEVLGAVIPNGSAKYAVSNASRLEYAGAVMAWGSRSGIWGQAPVQRVLEQAGALPIPFSVLQQANIPIKTVHIVEKGKAETVRLPVPKGSWVPANGDVEAHTARADEVIERHFVGAVLFSGKVEGGSAERFYLFDLDREEIGHGIFNLFLVALPKEVKTIAEAYASLMPQDVKEALEAGKKVTRQGEWFFIPADGFVAKEGSEALAEIRGRLVQQIYELTAELNTLERTGLREGGSLRHGASSPNDVQMYRETPEGIFVKGEVTHRGRQHRNLTLSRWHRVVPNTAVDSWQVTGDVD